MAALFSWPKKGHFFNQKGLTWPKTTQNGRNKGGGALITPVGTFKPTSAALPIPVYGFMASHSPFRCSGR
jgi:hypothetical protein